MISPEDSTSLQIHLVQLDLVVRSVVWLLKNEKYKGADDDMTLLYDNMMTLTMMMMMMMTMSYPSCRMGDVHARDVEHGELLIH